MSSLRILLIGRMWSLGISIEWEPGRECCRKDLSGDGIDGDRFERRQ